MADPTNIMYSSLINENYWTLGLTGVKMNGVDLYTANTNQAIVDSGTTVLVMEGNDYAKFLTQFQKEAPGFTEQQGVYLKAGACPTASDVVISVGAGVDLPVPSSQYLEEIQG